MALTNPLNASQEEISRALEWDLATLACLAAIEVDNLIHNRRTNGLRAVRRLVIRLSDPQTLSRLTGPSPHRLFDPSIDVVKKRAFVASGRGKEIRVSNVDAMIEKLRRLSASSEIPDQIPDDLPEVKAFCLALSREAASYGSLIYAPQRQRSAWS
jgi:hypothetical protein